MENHELFSEKISNSNEKYKTYNIVDIRNKHPHAYRPWLPKDDERLEILYCEGKSVKELSTVFGRQEGAIRSRINKLELFEKYG